MITQFGQKTKSLKTSRTKCITKPQHKVGLGEALTLLVIISALLLLQISSSAAKRITTSALPTPVGTLTKYSEARKQAPTKSLRIADGSFTGNEWQERAFRSIARQKRLDAMLNSKTSSKRKNSKRRPVTRKKRKKSATVRQNTARKAKSSTVSPQKTALKKPDTSPSTDTSIKTASPSDKIPEARFPTSPLPLTSLPGLATPPAPASDPVLANLKDPLKLQTCLKKIGYYDDALTGTVNTATVTAFKSYRSDNNLLRKAGANLEKKTLKALYASCDEETHRNLKAQEAKSAPKKKQAKAKTIIASATTHNALTGDANAFADDILAATAIAPQTVRIKDGSSGVGLIKIAKLPSTIPVDGSALSPMQVAKLQTTEIVKSSRKKIKIKKAIKSNTVSPRLRLAAQTVEPETSLPPRSRIASAKSRNFKVARLETKKTSTKPKQSTRPVQLKRPTIADLAAIEPASSNVCAPAVLQNQQIASLAVAPTAPISSGLPSSYGGSDYQGSNDGPLITGAIPSAPTKTTALPATQPRTRLLTIARNKTTCLPQDLYSMLKKNRGDNDALSVCKSDCQPAPKSFSKGKRDIYARQYNINWCNSGCLGIADPLPLKEVMKIEHEADVHVCMEPQKRLVPAVKKALDSRGINNTIRNIYAGLPGGYGNQGNIAVLIGNRNYASGIPVNDAGHINLNAMKALLIEQLGYKPENIITVRDAKRKDLIGLFGGKNPMSGKLHHKLKSNPDAQLLVYYSGHAVSKAAGLENHILPIDAVIGSENSTGYSLELLYDNLRDLDARSTQVFLEASFNENRGHMILVPNVTQRQVAISPLAPVRGLTVYAAAKGDQKTLVDHATGISLFTRHLISGLAGQADKLPIGNGDRVIDSVELYVHLASNVRLAARKTLGLMQNPVMSRTTNMFLSQLSRGKRK